MADELGTAVLKITVDDGDARQSLGLLRQEIEGASRQARTAASGGRAQGSARGGVRALEQAEERRFRDAQRKRAREITSNALIGGAFPLLFGQGAGAAIGGAAGGAAGGAIGGQFGFGLSLVGTAIGAQVDIAIQKFGELARALDDPIGSFATLVENASLSTKEVEKYAQALINSGRSAEAAALIQADLVDTFGSLQGAQEFTSSVDTLSRSWSRATTVLASFVSGPLAGLIRQLEQPTSGAAIGLSFEQLAGQLTPQQLEQVRARREQVTEASRQERGGVSAFLPPSNEDVNKGLTAGIELAKKLLGIEQQRAELYARMAAAQVLTEKALSTSYELITASVQGYEIQALEKQKEVALNERNIKLLELTPEQREGPEGLKVQQDTALRVFEIEERINAARKDRLATAQQEAGQFAISANALERQLETTQRLAKISTPGGVSILRDNAAFIEGIFENIAASVDRQQEIENRIRAAQLRGGGQAQTEIRALTFEQVEAAQKTRLELTRGATELRDAGQQLSRDVRNSIVEFTRIRSDEGGLNQFLSPAAQGRRAQEDFSRLLPQFREAQAQFFNITGQRAPEFQGPTAGVNEALRNFITAVDREFNAAQNLIQTTQALVQTNDRLAQAQLQLADATAQLAAKTWNVAVNVQGASGAQIVGDVVGAL